MTKKLLLTGSLLFAASMAHASDGKALFDTNCAKCHGVDGKGATKMGQKAGAPDFTDAKIQAALTDAKISSTLKEGIVVGDKTKMKAFPELSADDIKALAGYIKTFKK